MKKVLLGTTALVAAGMVAGQADAASGLKLGISGYYRGAMGGEFGSNDQLAAPSSSIGGGDFGRNNFSFRQEVRVNFTGSTTLDNGMTVGVLVGLNAGGNYSTSSNAPARINRAYMDLSGKFGQFRFGDANSAYQSMCVGDPGNVTANFGLNSPNESFSNVGRYSNPSFNGASSDGGIWLPTAISGAGTCFGLETRSTKLIYFSPTFGGFNFAVSYAPSNTRPSGGSGGNGGTNLRDTFDNFLSAGVNFNHDFGGVTVSAGISGEWALSGKTVPTDNASNSTNKPQMYQAGLQVGFGGGWAVGASGQYVVNYINAGYTNPGFAGPVTGGARVVAAAPSDDAYMITGGGSYTMDAISIGLDGFYDRWETQGNTTHITAWGVGVNAAYALGPGISLEGQVAYVQSNNNISSIGFTSLDGENSVEIDIGTAVNF